jgi:DNA-binding HxlR family transcriptional regulator
MAATKPFTRSPCAVANSLDIVGDKWSLLVVRDLLYGKRTFKELADSPERIPTNVLADRLRRLEDTGIISSTPYQQRPVRYAYALTPKGEDLRGVLQAFVHWGTRHIPGTVVLGKTQAPGGRARKPAARGASPQRGRTSPPKAHR